MDKGGRGVPRPHTGPYRKSQLVWFTRTENARTAAPSLLGTEVNH